MVSQMENSAFEGQLAVQRPNPWPEPLVVLEEMVILAGWPDLSNVGLSR